MELGFHRGRAVQPRRGRPADPARLALPAARPAPRRRVPCPGMRWPRWSSWRRQAVVGVLCQPAYLLLVFEGVAHGVPGGTAALIAALQPLLVATVAGRLLGEPTTLRMWAGMALGLVGVAIVVSGDLASPGRRVGLPAADGRDALPHHRHRARPSARPVRRGAPDDHDPVRDHRRPARRPGGRVRSGHRPDLCGLLVGGALADRAGQPRRLRDVRARRPDPGRHGRQHAALPDPAHDDGVGVPDVRRTADARRRRGARGQRRRCGPGAARATRPRTDPVSSLRRDRRSAAQRLPRSG